jgi:hypothetical protein
MIAVVFFRERAIISVLREIVKITPYSGAGRCGRPLRPHAVCADFGQTA